LPSLGVIVFNSDDHRITVATESADRLVNAYLGAPLGDVLPGPIADWTRAQRRRLNGNAQLPAPHEALTLAGRKRLTVCLPAEHILVLEETPADVPCRLTVREREVLTLVAEGKANAEIAARMWITTGTVRKHLEHIYEKLNVTSRTGAVARAFSVAAGQPTPNETGNRLL
jgi:DNA-binding NarL/FixJ family response regulator